MSEYDLSGKPVSTFPDHALAGCFRKHAEHGKYQRLSLQIVVLGVACGADDLFPYLRQPRKAGQVRVGIGLVGMQPLGDPAIDAVDERRERHPVAGTERIAERVELT